MHAALAEKGVEIPLVQINTREREQFTESFKAVNPQSLVPVLNFRLAQRGVWLDCALIWSRSCRRT